MLEQLAGAIKANRAKLDMLHKSKKAVATLGSLDRDSKLALTSKHDDAIRTLTEKHNDLMGKYLSHQGQSKIESNFLAPSIKRASANLRLLKHRQLR